MKITNLKGGKRYGPYPKNPHTYYLYESIREGATVKKVFRGKGPLPKGSSVVLQEIRVVVQESRPGVEEG